MRYYCVLVYITVLLSYEYEPMVVLVAIEAPLGSCLMFSCKRAGGMCALLFERIRSSLSPDTATVMAVQGFM